MGSAPPAPALPLGRLAGVGAVVFLANAALLVLQLVASRLLAPFIGSDLYSWTAIIGVFLTGIALGNAYGGKLADRYPSPRTLAVLLAFGAAAAVWMVGFYTLLTAAPGLYRALPLGPRVPVLTAVFCLPAGFVLSLLTPLAIKLGLPDVSKTGRVAGLVFALSTLGCLLGNYVTGFYLIPLFTINALVLVAAGTLLALAVVSLAVLRSDPAANPFAFADIRQAFAVVFLASFCGMTLELTASRVLAESIGVSLYTWTGIIGVMLAGTALGNLAGGLLADRVNRPGRGDPRLALAATLAAAGGVTILLLAVRSMLTLAQPFEDYGLIGQVLASTFVLFFLPMFALGMVSPQVIRLAVPDVAHAGRVAGRVYAWSTAGAIAGTFATGYVLISTLGTNWTVMAAAALLTATATRVTSVWNHNLLLYLCAVSFGGVTGGVIVYRGPATTDPDTVAVRETNYYTIKVMKDYVRVGGEKAHTGALNLYLDHLLHSSVKPDDPAFIHYAHEQIQVEFLRAARTRTPAPAVLVIGGGGYTYPRYAKTILPEAEMDVVEIDPGVTDVAYRHLGMKPEYRIRDFNMDGRQFVAEKAAAGHYDLVIEDAVNDLSVPAHLLTKEYNDAVKATLKPDGVYLLTVIDEIEHGKLWRAAMRTLKETFPHVALLSSAPVPPADPPANATPAELRKWEQAKRTLAQNRHVYVIYAAARPFDAAELRRLNAGAGEFDVPTAALAGAALEAGSVPFYTHLVPDAVLAPFLQRDPGVILTDQYAPVDNLMSDVFRRRE